MFLQRKKDWDRSYGARPAKTRLPGFPAWVPSVLGAGGRCPVLNEKPQGLARESVTVVVQLNRIYAEFQTYNRPVNELLPTDHPDPTIKIFFTLAIQSLFFLPRYPLPSQMRFPECIW